MFLIYFYTLICKNFIKRRIQHKLFLTFLRINNNMLKRWNIKIYNIDFLIAILDYVLTFIDLDLKFNDWRKESHELFISTRVKIQK
jgi:hypothetical protein